ncbi:MAG: DUF4330 family protein [Clostridia bacterium]|nr:DUF4330 family protein [Clostridia bacterium]MBQ6058774.1 DUF4330 family protein [Clostridia bacterium]
MGKRNTGKSTKLFGLFNLLDLLILVFLFALVGTLVLRSNLKESFAGSADDVTIDFSVRVEPVRVMTYMAVKEGDPLFDDETGVQIGTVTRVTATPYLREATLIDGTMVTSPDPEYLTVIIYAQGTGKKGELGFMLNGSRLCSPGGNIKVGSTKLATNGRFETVEAAS